MRPPIHSTKHYVQFSLFAVAGGAITTLSPASAVAVVDKNASSEVEEGSIIKAIWLDFWLTTDDAVQGSTVCIVEKVPGAQTTTVTTAQIASLQDYPNKKNVLFAFQGLTPPNTQYPMNVFHGWYKIPKSKQRFGLGDKLSISFYGQGDGLQLCGLSVYKEYT